MPLGTYTLDDLRANRFQSVVEFGMDTVQEVLERDLRIHNEILNTQMSLLVDVTTDRQRISGASGSVTMLPADEYDRTVAVKNTGGDNVGFPLRKYPVSIGWTEDYFYQATPADIADMVTTVKDGHVQALSRELRRAIFTPTNYTFRDQFMVPKLNLNVKAFANADGFPIPNGPNGEVFNAATHTHYNFVDSATPTAASLTELIDDVVEHGYGTNVTVNINRAAETAVRALTGFVPYADPRIVSLNTTVNTPGQRLDITRIDNRAIGLFGAAEVWVRSWVPAGYVFAFAGGPDKPLVKRINPAVPLQGLRVVATLRDYPLVAETMEDYFGFGVWNRLNGAVLYYAGGAVAYVAPTIS